MNLLRVLLVCFLLVAQCWYSQQQMLVFYRPLGMNNLFRPMRTLMALGMLRRRVRVTRRMMRLIGRPMITVRRGGDQPFAQTGSAAPRGLGLVLSGGRDRTQPNRDVFVPTFNDEAVFNTIRREDPTGCLLRLICELHALGEHRLRSEAELYIMEVFRDHTAHSNSTSSPFFAASELGRRTRDVTSCASYYNHCPFTSEEMMNTLTKSDSVSTPLQTSESQHNPNFIEMKINFHV